MESQVVVLGILRFPPENMEGVLPHLKKLVQATQNNDGCLMYEVAEDLFDKGLIRFSELWPDRASMEAHLKAPHIGPWREQAKKYGLIERSFNSYDTTSKAIPL